VIPPGEITGVPLIKRSRGGIMLSRELSVLPIVDYQDDEELDWEEELEVDDDEDEAEDYEFDDDDYEDEYAEYEDEFADDDEPRRSRRPAEWD
jgi:hypothetical protein